MSRIIEISHDRLDLLEPAYNTVYAKAFPLANERESLANMTEFLWLKKATRWGDGDYHIGTMVADGTPAVMSVGDYFSRTPQLRPVPAPNLKANQPPRHPCLLLHHPKATDTPIILVS
jgi:hypothetical protein